jgi:hypothetical protein
MVAEKNHLQRVNAVGLDEKSQSRQHVKAIGPLAQPIRSTSSESISQYKADDTQIESALSADYAEYLALEGRFDDKRLRKTLRKIDIRLLPVLGLFYLMS